jgi:LDH2 family malate/lactate/ureidoglycolate dehydrogenase
VPRITASTLTAFAERILSGAGVPADKASVAAISLVASNLRGVDSHGVQLVPYYVEQLLAGGLDPQADGRVVSESGCCLTFDGQNGLGQWVAHTCCEHAIRISRRHGIGMVTARESNHFGACAWWAQKIRDAGQIGIVICNASSIMPPWQGKRGRMGTNPICMSIPGPWLLDMATSTVAAGRIYKAWIEGRPEIPAGWALDSEGVPTTNTEAAYRGFVTPLGGYKGSGLAMMVEILCSILSGGAMCDEVGALRNLDKKVRTSQTFLAIDIARFMPIEEFTARVERLVSLMKSTPAAAGYDEVLVAGDPEWRAEAERRAGGIPIGDALWGALCKTAARVGVEPPPVERLQ